MALYAKVIPEQLDGNLCIPFGLPFVTCLNGITVPYLNNLVESAQISYTDPFQLDNRNVPGCMVDRGHIALKRVSCFGDFGVPYIE